MQETQPQSLVLRWTKTCGHTNWADLCWLGAWRGLVCVPCRHASSASFHITGSKHTLSNCSNWLRDPEETEDLRPLRDVFTAQGCFAHPCGFTLLSLGAFSLQFRAVSVFSHGPSVGGFGDESLQRFSVRLGNSQDSILEQAARSFLPRYERV